MTASLDLLDDNVYKALGNFLIEVLPSSVKVFQSQTNRVAEPVDTDFVVMNSVLQGRLSTNVDGYADALFTGSIAGTTLTITAVNYGSIDVGSPVLGIGIAVNTVVTARGTGSGGVGTYTVNNSQTVSSEFIAAGTATKAQPMQVTVQLDVHGPSSGNNSVIITTLFRDEYGVDQFRESGYDVTPLYTSDPKQLPFVNEEQQVEQRWMIEAVMQCNPIVTIPQAFADAVTVDLIEVDATYPDPQTPMTWNPSTICGATSVLSNENLTFTNTQFVDYGGASSTTFISEGQRYLEFDRFKNGGDPASNGQLFVGVGSNPSFPSTSDPISSAIQAYLQSNGNTYTTSTLYSPTAVYGDSPTDCVQLAIDETQGKLWFGLNGLWGGSLGPGTGDPELGTNPCFTFPPNTPFAVTTSMFSTSPPAPASVTLNARGPFQYSPPVGYSPADQT